jgi:hypothetical protein
MKAVLLAGYRQGSEVLGMSRDDAGTTLMDRRILQLKAMGLEVITVVAGLNADLQLRLSTQLAGTELVFDDHKEPSMVTNLNASLGAIDGAGAYILPVEVPPVAPSLWKSLKEEWRRVGLNSSIHVLQLVDAHGQFIAQGFPLLLTRKGVEEMKHLEDISTLKDPRLHWHPCQSLTGTLD